MKTIKRFKCNVTTMKKKNTKKQLNVLNVILQLKK